MPFVSVSQSNSDFYLSNQGEDIYPGTSSNLPRKTITATAPLLSQLAASKGTVKVALQSGSIFEENLLPSYPIEVRAYPDQHGNSDFAILDGSKEFDTGWIKQAETNYTFEQGIPYRGFTGPGITGIGFYSYIYVFEIDKELEKTAPITARKLLQFVTSLIDVENIPGSFYSPIHTWENPKLMYIHTSNGSSPNGNTKYRYEVSVRDWAVDSYQQPNNIFENLWVRGFGAGNGMLPGGDNSSYNKIIFGPGAAIHHLVAHSGTVDHSLFLPAGKNINDYAVVFYDTEGLGRHCSVKNSIFLDIRAPLYAHINHGRNYGAIEMDNVVGFADSTQRDAFMSTSSTDTVILNNIYADGYTTGYNYGSAKNSTINSCYFKDVSVGISYGSTIVNSSINNTFIKTKGTNFPIGIYLQKYSSILLKNSIVHIFSNSNLNLTNPGYFIYGAGGDSNKISSTNNIFICDIDPSATLKAATTNTNKGTGTSTDTWDNNVYILLKGNNIAWNITNASTNKGSYVIQNFEEWKKQSGQDVHSLFFDLRNDPRGLKAIFMDPDNGNYDLANTPEARQVAASGAGMISPLTCFIKKPSYEEAFNMIKNNIVLSVNVCRNPCQQNTLRINNTFTVKAIDHNKAALQWSISEQQNISHYELQKAMGNSVFRRIAIIPAAEDSLYEFTDDIIPGVPYQYRLLVSAKAGNACYSEVRTIKTTNYKKFAIYPNPSMGKLWISLNGYTGKGNYSILNSSGQLVLQKTFFSLYAPQILDLSQQSKGIYFIKMETNDGVSVQKFVIE